MQIVVIGSIRFPPDNMEQVRPRLQDLVHAAREDDGCVSYDVAEDFFEPGVVRISAIWADDEALVQHLGAAHVALWRAQCADLGAFDRKFMAYDAETPRLV